MSAENVELTRRAIEAYNAGDIDALVASFDSKVEFYAAWTAVGPSAYRGHDGVRRWFRELREAWDQIRQEVEAFFDLGDQVLVFGALHGRGKNSGVDVAMPSTQVLTFRNGKIVQFKAYTRRADALTDLGVSADALMAIDP